MKNWLTTEVPVARYILLLFAIGGILTTIGAVGALIT